MLNQHSTQHTKHKYLSQDSRMAQAKEVCEELDKVLLEFTNTLQELSELRQKYSTTVKEGYFTMAKARSSMGGPTSVSSLQYDAVMTPLVHVSTPSDPSTTYEDLQKLSLEDLPVKFEVDRIKPGKPATDKQSSGLEPAKEEGGLRKRKGGDSGGGGGVEDVPVSAQSGTEREGGTFEVEKEIKDPLKWFGILVPQSLRQSQQHFIKAVSLSVELAGVQMKVECLRRRYRQLLAKKNGLKLQQTTVESDDPAS